MARERIGLEAILDMNNFQLGQAAYTSGLGLMNSVTSTVSSAISNLLGQTTRAVLGFGSSVVSEGMNYTAAMSNVAAVTGAVGPAFDALSAKAEALGRSTKFTATEAAEGMGFLAMAGFQVTDILDAMPGVLNLAAAGNLDLGRSADIVSNILTGMRMSADQTGMAVDVLARTVTTSNTNIQQLGDGFKQVAPLASSLGYDVQQVSAALGKLGDAGIQGYKAGTALNSVLARLSAPTKAASATMDELGINIYDVATGEFLDLPAIIDQFNSATASMSLEQRQAALSSIFNQKQLSTMSILMDKGGDSMRAYEEQLRSGVTTAADIAAKQIDNLSGDLSIFQSALSGIKIDIFKRLEPVLRAVVQAGIALIDNFGGPMIAVFDLISPAITSVITSITGLISGFQTSASEAGTWGYNVAAFFADGIASGIGLITSVMDSISDMLSYWLSPGSPPRVAPHLDRWGADAMSEYLSGWGDADFKVFDDISDGIENALKSAVSSGDMSQSDLIPTLLGSRDAIAAAINELNATGQVSPDTFDAIIAAAGPAGESVRGLVESYLALTIASQDVETAQSNLDNAISNVDDAYKQLANATNEAEEKAALAAISTAEANRDKARSALDAAKTSEIAAKRQLAFDEKIQKIQEENAKLKAEAAKASGESGGESTAEKEAKARAKAERDYKYEVADTAGRIAMLRDELANTEEGSVEYYDILGQLHRLEEQRMNEEARTAEQAERDRASSASGSSRSISRARGAQARSARTTMTEEERAAEQARAAELQYQLSIADTEGKLKILRGQLANTEEGSADYYRILTQIAQLEKQQKKEAESGGGMFGGMTGGLADVSDEVDNFFGGLDTNFDALGDTIDGVGDKFSSIKAVFAPTLTSVTASFTRFKTTVVGYANEIYGAYSRGGVPAVLETLGITPVALQLTQKIRDFLFEVAGAVTSVAGAAGTAAVSFNWLGALNQTIIFLNDNFQAIKGALIGIGVAIAAIGVVGVIAGIVAAINPLTLAIGGIILVAGLLGAAWATNFLGIRDITTQVFGVISAVVGQFVSVFTDVVWPAISEAFANLTAALNSMGIQWSDIWTALGTAVGIVAGVIGVTVLTMIGFGLALVAGIASAVAAATSYWTQYSQGILSIFEGIGTYLGGWWNIIVGLFTLNMDQIVTGFDMLGQGLIMIVTGAWEAIKAVFQGGIDAVIAFVSTFSETIIGFFDAMYTAIVGGSIVPDLVNGVIEWFGNLTAPITAVVTGLTETVKGLFTSIFGFFSGSNSIELDFNQLIENFTVTLPNSVKQFTLIVQQAFGYMQEATTLYATFLLQTLVQQALPAATRAHQTMGSTISRIWNTLSGQADGYSSKIRDITLIHVPDMAKAFTTAASTISTDINTMVAAIGSIKTKLIQDTPQIVSKFGEIVTAITGVATAITGANGPIVGISQFQTKIDGLSTSKINAIKDAFGGVVSKMDEAIVKARELTEAINNIPQPPSNIQTSSNNLQSVTVPANNSQLNSSSSSTTNNNSPTVNIYLTVDSTQRMRDTVTLIKRTVAGDLT